MPLTQIHDSVPAAVQVTLRTFEHLIVLEEQRRRELLEAVVSSAHLRDPSQLLPGLAAFADSLAPHLDELRAIDRRIAIIRARLGEIRSRWEKAPGARSHANAPRRPWQGVGGGTYDLRATYEGTRAPQFAA